MSTAIKQTQPSLVSNKAEPSVSRWLVIGMGSYAYGKERRAVTALKHMPKIRPHFLTTVWEDGTVSGLLRRNGFEFTPATMGYLGRARLGWTIKNFLLMPSLFIKALHAFRRNHCCGILVLALQAFANLLPVLWFLKTFVRARIVFYLGDIPGDRATNRALCRVMGSMADVIIVNSEAVRRGFAQLGLEPQSIHVVYNGVEFDAIDAQRLSDEAKMNFGWPKESIVVSYAGQLTRLKGILDFLAAAEVVHKAEPKSRFIIFGHANQQDEFMRLLLATSSELRRKDALRFAGYSTNMFQSYRNVDIQIVPSRHEEALGNVPIEAAAAGVPVIASNVGGIAETIVHEQTGVLVEKEAPEQIAAQILTLAADPELRRSMGAAARLRAQLQFDARKNAAVVEELMLSTLS